MSHTAPPDGLASHRVVNPPVPRLTVVIANPGSGDDLRDSLTALQEGIVGEPLELLLVGSTLPSGFPSAPGWVVRTLPVGPNMLVPDQWGVGLRHASAPLIAFFSGDTRITPAWWPSVAEGIEEDRVAGIAGGICLAPSGRPDTGVFLARYAAFLPQADGGEPRPTTKLPGEATLYRREALSHYPDLLAGGFWETLFHERLQRDGWQLRFHPHPLAQFKNAPGVVAFTQQRCEHAIRHGVERVYLYGHSRIGITLRAPLVPAVMCCRVIRLAAPNRWGRAALRSGLPRLLLYLTAWAWGECVGAWRRSDRHRDGTGVLGSGATR